MKKIIILLIISIALLSTAFASGERRILGRQLEDGSYKELLNVGECEAVYGCVIDEKTTTGGYIHQFLDFNNDKVCDIIFTWKPIDDPTYGRFYTPYKTMRCNDVI